MTGYSEVNLSALLEEVGEDRVNSILSNFSCPLNKDVEDFLRRSAVPFAQQSISRTYLLFASFKDDIVLIGYYTLANKMFSIPHTAKLSKTMKKRINKFATYNKELRRYDISAPLIAQLGKNFANGYNTLITGDELLDIACRKVQEIHNLIGGKVAYLECEDKPALVSFYERNGFKVFSHRPLDADEKHIMVGDCLLQMVRYFGKEDDFLYNRRAQRDANRQSHTLSAT